jgi:hypothetical protein
MSRSSSTTRPSDLGKSAGARIIWFSVFCKKKKIVNYLHYELVSFEREIGIKSQNKPGPLLPAETWGFGFRRVCGKVAN